MRIHSARRRRIRRSTARERRSACRKDVARGPRGRLLEQTLARLPAFLCRCSVGLRQPAKMTAADELYGLPLAEFTKARDELARRLRKEGKGDEADAVKALRKPTAAAWALNQLSRQRPKDIKALLATGKRLRKAHEALIGGGDRSALQKASAEERELIDSLVRDTNGRRGARGAHPQHAARGGAGRADGGRARGRPAVARARGRGLRRSLGGGAQAGRQGEARRQAPRPSNGSSRTPRRRNRRPSASTSARSSPSSGQARVQTRRRGEPTRLAPHCATPSSASGRQPRQPTARLEPSMQ